MSIDDMVFAYCSRCKRHTAQETFWDASSPNRVEYTCLECQPHHNTGHFINLINWLIEDYSPSLAGTREWVERTFPETNKWHTDTRIEAT